MIHFLIPPRLATAIALLCGIVCSPVLSAATYYVATNGNDSRSTTQAQSISSPWKTIQKAATKMVAGDTCLIRAGTYRETVTVPVSGTALAPITFQPYSTEVVIISGSQPISGWTLESTNIYRATNMPSGWSSLGNGNQVFQGTGTQASLVMKPEARWPNAGSTFPWQNSSINPSPDWTYVNSVTYSSNTNGQAVDTQLPTRPDGYWTNATLHMMSGDGWVMECPTVTGYTDATKTLQFVHGDWGGGADNAFNVTAGNEFYITGIKGEMDSPGEWFYDTTTSRLCFYSTSTPTNVEVKQRAYGFDLSGRSFINLANLQFFACTINTSPAPTMTTDCTFNGLTMKYLNHSSLTDAATGLNLGSRCVLRNSELSFASGGLVYVNGTDVRLINNKLHDALYSPTFQGGIACSNYGADGNASYRNLISHNTIYNFGRAAIGYPGRAAIIEYNDIYNGMVMASDGGVCYWAQDGCDGIIRYNLIHDAQGPVGHLGAGVMGFYVDNENSGWVAHHNVIWNISGMAMQNNARNNFDMIFNNTCWNCGGGSIVTGFWCDGPTGGKYFNNLFNGMPSGNQQPWNLSDARYNLYTDPLLVDPANRNFHLQASSPAIDQGKVISGITDGYLGSAPDIGALEYGAADWTGSAGYHTTPPSPDPVYAMPAMPFANQLQDGSFEQGNLSSCWTLASGSNAGLIQSDAWSDDHLRSSYFSVQFGGGTSQLSQAVTGLLPHQQYNFYCGVEKTDPTAVVTVSVRTNGLPDQTITVPTTTPWQQQTDQPVPTMFAVPFFTVDGNATVSVTVTRAGGSAIVPAGATTAAPMTTISAPSVYPTTGVYVDDLAVVWSQGQPGLVLNEGFDYPTGALDGSQNGGSGFTSGSNWGTGGANIVTGLTYSNLTAGGSSAISPSSQGIHSRAVSPSFGGSTFYMSMLVNANSHETTRFGLGLGSGSGPMFGRVNGGWGMCTGTNGSLGISNSGGDNQTWTGVSAAADSVTHLIVVKVDYEANALRLYVDPTPGATEPTPSATLTTGGGWSVNLNSDLWSAISLVHDLAGMTADELRVGNAWSDVTPAAPSLPVNIYTWTGVNSNDLNDSYNWTPTATGIPTYNKEFDIETPGANVTQSGNTYLGQLMVGSASGAPAVLNITHQISTNNDTIAAGATWTYNYAQGTINHTAGAIVTYNPGDSLWILVGCSINHYNTGIYNFGGASPGPSISAAGTGAGIAIGGGHYNTGVMTLSGYGTINIADPIYIGTRDCWSDTYGNGTLNITGGHLTINAGALYAGGHQGSSSILPGQSSATLNVTIDSTGISAINAPIVQIDSLAGFTASVSGFTPTVGTVYTIINSTNPIGGTFANLSEGSYVQAGSYWFTISYLNNKVTLTSAATPTSLPAWLAEGFNYTTGSSLTGLNGGTGFASGSSWSTTAADTVGTGLSYPGLSTAGGGDLHTGNYGGSTRSIVPIASSSYYISMLINMHGQNTVRCGPELQLGGSDGCLFGRVTGGWGMFAPGNGAFGVSNTNSWQTWTGVTVASDSNTHLLVYKFDSIAKTISMWVDPTVSTTIPAPSATLSTGGNWTINLGTSFNDVRFFHEQAGCDIDELRFGGYWQAVLPAPPTNTFTNWMSNYPTLTGANVLPGATPSHDGLSNLVKYGLGMDPTVASHPPGTHTGNTLAFTKGAMAKVDSNIAYSIEESTDLVNWGTPTLGTVAYGDTITYTYPSGTPKVFARLKVIQTP